MNRQPPAIVQQFVSIQRLAEEWSALDAREARTLTEIRVERGRLLVAAKAAVKHGGWLPLLASWKVEERTARNYMALYEADKTEKLSDLDAPTPTYAAAGIVKATAKPAPLPPSPVVEDEPDEEPEEDSAPVAHVRRPAVEDDDLPVFPEEERAKIREQECADALDRHVVSMGGHIEEREAKVRELRLTYAEAQSLIIRCHQRRGIHLSDATTCPADFDAIKRLAADIIDVLLSELEGAGTDGKTRRTQLLLLQGGSR